MISQAKLLIRYSTFAAAAIATNIGAQWLVMQIWKGPFNLICAMIVGTGLGLVMKYILDKRWIFFDTEGGVHAHSRKFILYTMMGAVTTLIFWAIELAFYLIWKDEFLTYVGAIVGLGIGYVAKYYLDRRYVFRFTIS